MNNVKIDLVDLENAIAYIKAHSLDAFVKVNYDNALGCIIFSVFDSNNGKLDLSLFEEGRATSARVARVEPLPKKIK